MNTDGHPAPGRPNKKDIEEAVEASGYLLEQRVRRLLVSRYSSIETNVHYQDPDEGTSREIDIVVDQIKHAFDRHAHVEAEMLFGCRDNRAPLVFFTNRQEDVADPIEACPYVSGWPLRIEGKGDEEERDVRDLLGWARFCHHIQAPRLARQYAMILPKAKGSKGRPLEAFVAEHGDFYTRTLLPIIKALASRAKEHNSDVGNDEETLVYLCAYYPIIVLGGELWEYRIGAEEPLRETGHVVYVQDYRSRTVDGQFVFDVVTEANLPNLLSLIDRAFAKMLRAMRPPRKSVMIEAAQKVRKAAKKRDAETVLIAGPKET